MSFSGSVVFLIILICTFWGKNLLCPKWIYTMLKINLFFYCLPLPLLKSNYNNIFYKLFGISLTAKQWDSPMRNVIEIDYAGNIYYNWKLYLFVIWSIWLIGLLSAYRRHSNQYKDFNAKDHNIIEDENYLQIFDRVKQEVGIRKKITLICANDCMTICTLGIKHKYIKIPKEGIQNDDLYYIFKHELIHIKKADVLFRYIAVFILLIHWFNPFIYLYFYMLSIYCEQSCDAYLVDNLEKSERKKYGQLIINMSLYEPNNKQALQTYFSSSKNNVERRLKNIMKNNTITKLTKLCSLFISGIVLFCGSLTVFAYEQPTVIKWEFESDSVGFEDEQGKQVERTFINSEDLQFSDQEAGVTIEFIDENGNSYQLTEADMNQNQDRIACSHSFESGYHKKHTRNSDMSCKTEVYYADRCK